MAELRPYHSSLSAEQIENQIIYAVPRINSVSKNWEVYNTETEQWVDTEVKAEGEDGTDGVNGVSPRINSTSKNWEVYNVSTGQWLDTGIKAEGYDGLSPRINATNHRWEVYSHVTGQWTDTGITAEGSTINGTFYAEYGVTTFQAIKTAYEAGNNIVCFMHDPVYTENPDLICYGQMIFVDVNWEFAFKMDFLEEDEGVDFNRFLIVGCDSTGASFQWWRETNQHYYDPLEVEIDTTTAEEINNAFKNNHQVLFADLMFEIFKCRRYFLTEYEYNPFGESLSGVYFTFQAYVNGNLDTYTCDASGWNHSVVDLSVAKAVEYLTTAPTANNPNGLIAVYLDAEPAQKYSGYIYFIKE